MRIPPFCFWQIIYQILETIFKDVLVKLKGLTGGGGIKLPYNNN